MNFLRFASRQASVLWLDPHRIVVGGQSRPSAPEPTEDQLAQALTSLPSGPTKWILDDSYAPSVILRDIMEVPSAGDARDAFFSWKFAQSLALEVPVSVQALPLSDAAWLLVGLPNALLASWTHLATRMNRPIHHMAPRWLWLYNRLAPTLEKPGMLLSLSGNEGDGYSGTLAAWGRHLVQVRQWMEPASVAEWMEDRVRPTQAYLTRESRTPQELWIWGASSWPKGDLATQVVQQEIPLREGV